jgi:hypothetical protein
MHFVGQMKTGLSIQLNKSSVVEVRDESISDIAARPAVGQPAVSGPPRDDRLRNLDPGYSRPGWRRETTLSSADQSLSSAKPPGSQAIRFLWFSPLERLLKSRE